VMLVAVAFAAATLGFAAASRLSSETVAAAESYKNSCAGCHAFDGTGTPIGKVPDLRSPQVQSQPDSALFQVIREGKGNMPSFGRSLDSAQIEGLVQFIRQLNEKTPAAKSVSTSVVGKAQVSRSPSQRQGDWTTYGGAAENNHYSALAQINSNNVKQLAVAWSFDSQEEGGLQTSPIVVEGVLYGITPTQKVFALDAITGQPISSCGDQGRIDLRDNLDRQPVSSQSVYLTSPGIIYKDLLIVGGRNPETPPAPPGSVRALRRAQRKAALVVSYHPSPRRVRIRNLAHGCVEDRRCRQQLGRHGA